MVKRKIPVAPKPIEQFDKKDWEAAYNQLNAKLDRLKNKMRKAMNAISQAQNYLSEAVL
ncbi:hypothetical protein ES703_82879 [subsurface metagenome]